LKIYYLQLEYQPGKHRVIQCLYDFEVFKFDESTLSPYSTLIIDEIDPANKTLCIDLVRTVDRTDLNGEGKYYIDGLGTLMQVAGWTEYIPEVFY